MPESLLDLEISALCAELTHSGPSVAQLRGNPPGKRSMHAKHHAKRAQLPLLLTLLTLAVPAWSAERATPAELQARYQAERSVCLNGQSQQDRPTCLREAGAAYAEARRGGLEGDAESWRRNAVLRCQALQGDERFECIARMQGQGTTSGSAASGGIYRELVTVSPAAPTASAPQTLPQ